MPWYNYCKTTNVKPTAPVAQLEKHRARMIRHVGLCSPRSMIGRSGDSTIDVQRGFNKKLRNELESFHIDSFIMLVLSMLHSILSQVLSPPYLHTAILFTPAGELVSFASEPVRPKDEIRIIVGLCGEVWQETKEQGYGMVDSEVRVGFGVPFWLLTDRVDPARSNHRSAGG